MTTIILVLLSSCNTTKYVGKDEYLLSKIKIKCKDKDCDKDQLKNYIRQTPNRKILGTNALLGIYSLSQKGKDNWINQWLRSIGEKPVILDEYMVRQSREQLRLYLVNQGYRNAEVSDTLIKQDHQAKVLYRIKANQPYRIKQINYNIHDTGLSHFIMQDTSNSLLRKGMVFNLNVLEEERKRITHYLKSKGYYSFSPEYVFFQADTNARKKAVDLTLEIKKYRKKDPDSDVTRMAHPRYKIKDIYVVTDYDKEKVLRNREQFYETLDTVCTDSIYFLYHDELSINPDILTQSIYVQNGSFYNYRQVEETNDHLSALQILRLVNIKFDEVNDSSRQSDSLSSVRLLNCRINLTPGISQSYTIDIEGTNSSGDIGIGGNLSYQHKNLFRNAEVFNFRIRGGLEAIKERNKGRLDNTMEFGSQINLRIPRFILPFKGENFVKRYNPSSAVTLSYSYQQRPDYTRRILNTSFGYKWKGSPQITHIVNPVEVNFVRLLETTKDFRRQINLNPYLRKSYEEHFLTVSNYSFIYNNQDIEENRDFIYFRFNAESAGNMLTGISEWLDVKKQDGAYHLFDNRFAQYIKGDVDFRYYQQLNPSDKLVYRFFAGAAYPYGNSSVMLFEKKYFAGGANSIRAWQVRALGPGSYKEKDYARFPNNLADIKLEGNFEYRFDLFWVLEGALFTDFGNVWAINKEDEREGALFKWNRFYNDIAVGSGFGTRFDFSFFVFRIDFGIKMRDPAKTGEKWIFNDNTFNSRDFNVNVGIGYPF